MNIVKEWDHNAIHKDKFHWTAPDGGEKKKVSCWFVNIAETTNLATLYMCCVRMVFNVTSALLCLPATKN